MVRLTLKKKIIIFAIMLLVLAMGCSLAGLWGLKQEHIAQMEMNKSIKIYDNFQELRTLFEQTLMGPHDYLIHMNKEEKEIFLKDYEQLFAKTDSLKTLIIGHKVNYGIAFEGLLSKAEKQLLIIEDKLPEFKMKALDFFELELPQERHRAGFYMEEMDDFIRELEASLKKEGTVLLEFSDKAQDQINIVHARVLVLLITFSIIAVFIGIILSHYLIRSITGPLGNLIQATRKIKEGDLTIRADVKTSDEISELAGSFNEMVGELADVQEHFSTILRGSGDAMRIIDNDYNILQVNRQMEQLAGISAEKTVGKKCYEVFGSDYCHTNNCTLKRILMGEEWTERESTRETGDGTKIVVELVATPFKKRGKIIGIIESFRDITKRKMMEEELQRARDELEDRVKERTAELARTTEKLDLELMEHKRARDALLESEKKYRSILESIEEGYYEVDIKGNFSFFNDSICRIFGYTRDELMGMNNRQLMDQENAKKVYQTYNRLYRTGSPENGFDWELARKDGTKRHVESSASLIKDAEGQRIGFRGIIRDVTEKKLLEKELIKTRNFLQNILNSSIDGIMTTDLKGKVIYSTPKVKDILGYDNQETIGESIYSFYEKGKEDAKRIMKELTEKGEVTNHEVKLIKKDGTLIEVSLSGSLLMDENGEVIGTLGIFRDITDKKNLEAQLQRAQKMESIGTLAGGIAHNFNNLLMGIIGNTTLLLLEIKPDHPSYNRLNNIETLVHRGSELTRQLLGYARGGRYEVKPLSLNHLIKETSYTFDLARKDIRVHQDLAKELSVIMADQGQIEQVLLNLYVNAADAMPKGGDLFLKTANITHKDIKGRPYAYKAKPGNYVLLTIRDTGVGMDKNTIDRIFDPFFTTKGLARGTGLGLTSAYGIIENHGGYINVESKMGHGTTFYVYLPAYEEEATKKGKELLGDILEGTETVLLVDDEDMVIAAGEQMLKKLGYQVLLAMGGLEAVELYKKNREKIDIVLLDMVMPDMGAAETYERLKEINPNVKVLLSSGYSIEGDATEILEHGCNGFIQKPFSLGELSQKIREILDKK